jgi:hypothetical protein
MGFPSAAEQGSWHARDPVVVPKETLHVLSLMLATAARLHATRERLAGLSPWRLVEEVQKKLLELGLLPETAVSDEWLMWFLEDALVAREAAPPPEAVFMDVA